MEGHHLTPHLAALGSGPRTGVIHIIDQVPGQARLLHSTYQDCQKGLWQAAIREGDYKLIWGQVPQTQAISSHLEHA